MWVSFSQLRVWYSNGYKLQNLVCHKKERFQYYSVLQYTVESTTWLGTPHKVPFIPSQLYCQY